MNRNSEHLGACGFELIDSEDACAISSVSNSLPMSQPPQTTSRTPPTQPRSVSMTLPHGSCRELLRPAEGPLCVPLRFSLSCSFQWWVLPWLVFLCSWVSGLH